jgi:hypothetical protein
MSTCEDIGSDHLPVKILIQVAPVVADVTVRRRWKFNDANLRLFSENIVKSRLNTPIDVDSLAEDFTARLHRSAVEHIPRTTGKIERKKCTVWWNDECSLVVGEGRKARKALERTPTLDNVSIYREKTAIASDTCKHTKKQSIHKFVSEIKYDTPLGVAWRKLQALKGHKMSRIGPLLSGAQHVTDSATKAALLAETFAAVA